MSSAPSLTLSAPNPVLVNTAVTISGTIDAADAAAGTQIEIYSGTTLLGSTTANASGVWSLAATVTAGSTDSITARATNATGQTTTAAVTLHSFVFANSAVAAAAQTLASEIDAAAASTVDVVTASGAVTIPSSAAYVVDEATSANTISSATDPDMFIGTAGTTVTFTAATAPATQQQIVEADDSAAASLANVLPGDGAAPAGSNEFDFEGVANVAFTGNANNGIEVAAGTLVTGSGADFIGYGGANSGAIEVTLKGVGATVVGSDTGTNSAAEIVDTGFGNTVFAGVTPTTIMGSSASGTYYLGNLNSKDAYIGGSTPSEGYDLVVVGAYGGVIYGGANTVDVITGSGAVDVSGGDGIMNIYEVGTGAVTAVGAAGGTISISGSGASSTVVVANSGPESFNLIDASAAIVEGGSGTDFVALGSGDSYFIAGSGQATIVGGSAPDDYVFVSGNAGRVDTITNFKSSDQIDVGGYANAWAYVQGHETISGGNLTFSLPDGTSVTLDGVTSLAPSQFFDLAAAQVNIAGLTGGDAVEGTPIVATASGLGGFGAITYNFTVGSTLLQSGTSNSYTPGYGAPAGETITVTASRGSGFAATASAGPLQAADAPGTLTLAGLTGGNAVEGTPIVATIGDPNGAPATATYIFKSGSTTLQTGESNSYTPGYSSSGEAITASAAYTDGQGFSDTASASAGTVQAVTDGGGAVTCYCSGTRILTVRGEVAVEDLAVNDLVVTSSGAHRPIRWLGHRTLDCRTHPRPEEAHPTRITRHAFGENKPARDLYLSPGHAICLDVMEEVLIPVCALTNGSTVVQTEVDQVTYWHVELDSHDILIANGLPAESYIEMGNRNFFVENDVIGFDMSPDADIRTIHTHADYCRPLVFSGPALDAVQALLRHRAEELGWALVDSLLTDLHIMAGNTRIDPIVRGLTARFYVPAGVGDAWLVSATSRPIDVGKGDDNRHLGVSLAELTIDDGFGKSSVIALNDPLLSTGFHRFEEGWRWTSGRAHLPAGLWNGYHDGFFLRVQLTSPALPQWVMTPPLAAAPSGQDQAPVPQIA